MVQRKIDDLTVPFNEGIKTEVKKKKTICLGVCFLMNDPPTKFGRFASMPDPPGQNNTKTILMA